MEYALQITINTAPTSRDTLKEWSVTRAPTIKNIKPSGSSAARIARSITTSVLLASVLYVNILLIDINTMSDHTNLKRGVMTSSCFLQKFLITFLIFSIPAIT